MRVVYGKMPTVSLPSRERGLKCKVNDLKYRIILVAPLAGAWIEITAHIEVELNRSVAPLAGAWIEIMRISLRLEIITVAPLAGAWIEIVTGGRLFLRGNGRRSPRGSVD